MAVTGTGATLGEFGFLIAGGTARHGTPFEVRNPYDGSLVAVAHLAGSADIERAIAAAVSAFATTRALPAWKRSAVLETITQQLAARREELARIISLEAGKPIRTARLEVDRAIFTFKVAGEEARRIQGEIISLDWLPGTERREAHIRRVALGPVAGITPFNFPLLLVAHKMAPAIAAGDPVIIRPGPRTPISALVLGDIARAAGWPPDALSVFPCSNDDTARLVEDDRIKLLSFTGSAAVGWALKARAGRKRVTLELGGNAAVIVHRDADVAYAAERISIGGFSYAGQSCISAQRIYVHDEVYGALVGELVGRANALIAGDPLREETDLGPVIDAAAANRIGEWLEEAKAAGAEVLAGGTRQGAVWRPTVLAGAPASARVNCAEVFAPLVSITRYTEVAEAIASANSGDFGLQAGIFSHDDRVINAAIDGIEAGAIIVNDTSTFRVDHMPYGGVKQSGFGREGLRYAIEEMTEMKLVAFNQR